MGSDPQKVGEAQMPPHDIDELRIAPRRPDRRPCGRAPDHQPGDPEPQAEPDRAGQRAVDDREPARRAAEQDRLGQRAVHRNDEAGHGFGRRRSPSDQRPAAEGEERQEEGRGRKGDRQAEDDLDQPPEAARGVAEGQRQAGDDDDDHRDDLGDRPLDGFEDRLKRRFPGHGRAGRMGGPRDGKSNDARRARQRETAGTGAR